MRPAHNTTKGVGKPPKPPLQPDPLDTPLPSPHIRNKLGPPTFRELASKGTCCFFSLPPAATGAPIKTCLNFLSDR